MAEFTGKMIRGFDVLNDLLVAADDLKPCEVCGKPAEYVLHVAGGDGLFHRVCAFHCGVALGIAQARGVLIDDKTIERVARDG